MEKCIQFIIDKDKNKNLIKLEKISKMTQRGSIQDSYNQCTNTVENVT